MNLTHEEPNKIAEIILNYTGRQLFLLLSKKSVKAAKLIENLTGIVTDVNEQRSTRRPLAIPPNIRVLANELERSYRGYRHLK